MSKEVWLLENELMQAAFRSAEVAMAVIDASGRIVTVTDSVCERMGLSSLDLLGQPFQLLLHHELHLPKFRELFQVDGPLVRVKGRINRGGVKSTLLFNGSTYTTAAGEKFRIVVAIDPTYFGASYDQITSARHHLQAMNTAFVVIDTSLTGHPVIEVNAVFERIFGFSAKDVVGKNIIQTLRPRAAVGTADAVGALNDALLHGRNSRQILSVSAKDGATIHVDWRQSPLQDEQRITGRQIIVLAPMHKLPQGQAGIGIFEDELEFSE